MALWAIGSKVYRGNGTDPEEFTQIAEITGVTPPSKTTDIQDVTTLDSENGYEEVVATIIRNGEATITMNLDSSGDLEQFEEDQDTRKMRAYRIVDPDDEEHYHQFNALVQEVAENERTPDGFLSATITLKPSGKRTRGTGGVAGS